MTPHCIERRAVQDAAEIGVWENEGGAAGSASMDQDRRRIGADRARSVYRIFAGVAAAGRFTIGPNRPAASESTTSIDLRDGWRRKQRMRLTPPDLDAAGTESSW